MNVLAETLKDMEADAQKLYQLIWRQFVACQMTPAQYDSTTLTVAAGDFKLKARGRTLRFDGWTKVMPALRKGDEDRTLPLVKQGDRLSLVELTPAQHFTKPPARFSEASLVKELEKRGIGRPSTYASIISTIQDRGYVRVENRRFYAEKMGEIVTDRLEENFRDLMNYDFTAQMEDRLDQSCEPPCRVERGAEPLLRRFYHPAGDGRERSGRGRHAAEPDGAHQHRLPDLRP